MRKLLVAAALTTSAILSAGVGSANADTTVTVTPANFATGGHWFTADTRSPGTGAFDFGPATPPLGAGGFRLTTSIAGAKAQLLTDLYNGTPLSSITGIGYSTYMRAGGPSSVAMAGLNLRVDTDNNNAPDAYFVYEPYADVGNAAVQTNVWQNWDAYRGGAAKWWVNNVTNGNPCSQSVPCTWSTLLTTYSTATIRESALACGAINPCNGSLGVNQGSGNAGADSTADALYVSVSGEKTTYNFEPTADTTKPSCGAMVVRRAGGSGTDEADVTITDSGSGIASVTNFVVTNGTASIPPITPGASSVTVTAIKTTQGVPTRFEFDVTDRAGNTVHCV